MDPGNQVRLINTYMQMMMPLIKNVNNTCTEFGDAKKSDNSVRVIENSIRQEGNTMTFWLKHDPWVYGLYFNPIAKCIGELKVQGWSDMNLTKEYSLNNFVD